MAPARRRVSYIIPPPADPVPRLQLPPHGASKTGSSAPLLLHSRRESPSEPWPKWAQHPRHRLGVCCLALDTATQLVGRSTPEGILYSGGRDGMVISWDLGIPMRRRDTRYGVTNNGMQRSVGRWEIMTGWADEVAEDEDEVEERSDGDILGDVQDISGRRRRRRPTVDDGIPWEERWETDLEAFQPGQMSQFRQSVQSHTDWVNDVVLCNHNQTLVSASSDGTIKAWSPHAAPASEPITIGTHDDYVRCLSYCRDRQWLASGSFDRTIKIWDPTRTAQDPLMTLNAPEACGPKASVYALATDPYGSVIASGSPERVVRMWDPRSGKRTSKLVGHTDNIRAILISEDSRYLLTGSADASVKLWSLATQRCLHTFTHHADSVWSLYSNHPSLEIFYSGDRAGLVCKVDVEGCTDISEGECVLLAQESDKTAPKALDGINKIVAMDDNVLWTASGSSSIRRWRVPQRRAVRAMMLGSNSDENLNLTASPMDSPRERQASPSLGAARFHSPSHSPSPTPRSKSKRMSSLSISDANASKLDAEREGDETWYGLPFESLIKLTSPNEGFSGFGGIGRGRDPEVATLYSAASVMSVPRLVRSPLQAVFSGGTASANGPSGIPRSTSPIQAESMTLHSRAPEETLHPRRTARAEFEDREMASDAVPLHAVPDEIIHGEQGLVRCALLNDRVHALTVDTEGAVAVWDIVRGVCLGRFTAEDVAEASFCGSTASSRGSQCDVERSPREALETVKERIEGEAVVASWASVDTKTGLLSVHLSERCFEAEIYADEAGFSNDKHFTDEARINVGKWVLRNLFINFIRDQQRANAKRVRESSVADNHRLHRSTAPMHIDLSSPSPEQPRSPPRSSSDPRRSPTQTRNSVVVTSPNMVPAVAPGVTPSTRSSPLIPPMIPINTSLRETTALSPIPQSPLSNDNTPMPRRSATIDHGSPATRENDYFSLRGRRPSVSATPAVPIPPSPDDFGSWGAPPVKPHDPTTPSTPGGLMGRLKAFGKTPKRSATETPSTTTPGVNQGPESATPADVLQHSPPKTPLQTLFAAPLNPPSSSEAPSIAIPAQTSILISEECPSGWSTLYRGQVASTGQDARALEEVMPFWLLEYLLVNKIPPIPTIKVSFVLLPYRSKDPNEEQLPELLNTAQSKLTASRFLRVRKLTHHVQDKLDKISNAGSRTTTPRSSMDARSLSSVGKQLVRTESDPRIRPEDQFEILCNEAVLPLDMTLASVRQFVWRQSGELVMYYRRRKVMPGQILAPAAGHIVEHHHLSPGLHRPDQHPHSPPVQAVPAQG
ncbi:WD40 repeat domain-containing protein [Phanerochaete sordida]|uniref:WD40 repeat domain-containing protein n=1 Tax=Phanerochaete sordida TaxID=48140 RepID=A0A9P3LLR7_9APHY|nr:WD40 repeat domain-containing protein [Phanerochaete sordida]